MKLKELKENIIGQNITDQETIAVLFEQMADVPLTKMYLPRFVNHDKAISDLSSMYFKYIDDRKSVEELKYPDLICMADILNQKILTLPESDHDDHYMEDNGNKIAESEMIRSDYHDTMHLLSLTCKGFI